jgi:hypothetical protein
MFRRCFCSQPLDEFRRWLFAFCFAVLVVVASAGDGQAQLGSVGGVYVDPEGMLRETSRLSKADLRKRLEAESAEGQSASPVTTPSVLRKVSLRRLETAVAALHAAGKPLPADIRYVAGLNRVEYVFFYPEAGDVVLAGPAGGWETASTLDVVARTSGRPVLHLDDLVVALRYAYAEHAPGGFLGCSIEPTEQGAKAHATFIRKLGSVDGTQLPQILNGMEQAVGPQDVHVYGTAGSSRFALEMVSADYRLKRIALAHDPSPSEKVPSYLDLAERTITGGPQRQHRWWFVGHYDAIRHTADHLAYSFEGTGLKVDTAPTQAGPATARNAPKPSRAAKSFAELATRNLPELCEMIPVFAELENLVALAVAGVLIRRHADAAAEDDVIADGDEGAGGTDSKATGAWRPTHFLNEKLCPIDTFETPRQTPSLANARFVKDQFWLFSVSGGVEINPEAMAGSENLKAASGEKLGEARGKSAAAAKEIRWWWD